MEKELSVCIESRAFLSISINYELSKYEREFSDFKEKQREKEVDVCILQLNIFMIYVNLSKGVGNSIKFIFIENFKIIPKLQTLI